MASKAGGPRGKAPTRKLTNGGASRYAAKAPNVAALEVRRREILAMVVSGVPLSQIAERYGLDISTISRDYRHAAKLYGPPEDEVQAWREEISERQRSIIMGHITAARAGDPKAAAVVQRSDSLLSDIWGLKIVKVDHGGLSPDGIDAEFRAMLAGADVATGIAADRARPQPG